MNAPSLALDWRLIGVTLAGLFFFGLAYNTLVTRLGDRKAGYTSFLVVGGVAVNLGALALFSWQSALLMAACFIASGTPMIIGEIQRHIQEREAALQALRSYPHPDMGEGQGVGRD